MQLENTADILELMQADILSAALQAEKALQIQKSSNDLGRYYGWKVPESSHD